MIMRKNAFTLLELMIVVIVVGILASLAVARFSHVLEKAKLSEGVDTLATIWRAQTRYFILYGSYQCSQGANNPGNWDITVESAKYFDWYAQCGVAEGQPWVAVWLASVHRQDGPDYNLYIDFNGTIGCEGADCGITGYPITEPE